MTKILSRVLAALLVVAALFPAAPANAAGFEARRVSGSVVYIAIFNDDKKLIGHGSGFVVAPGIVVTNYHVASAGPHLVIVPNGDDGKNAVAAVMIYGSREHDIAIVKAPDLKSASLTIFAGDPAQGVPVWAYGFPGVADTESMESTANASLYTGIVSRVLTGHAGENDSGGTRLIQHSALIAPGNSGGPLFDQCHRVVGINSFLLKENQQFLYSVSTSELPTLLSKAGVTITPSYAACGDTPAVSGAPAPSTIGNGASKDNVPETAPVTPPTDDQLQDARNQEKDRAHQQADAERAKAKAARAAGDRARGANNPHEAARQDAIARDAQKTADELDSYADALKKQLDDARDPFESYGPILAALAVALGMGAVVFFAHRRYAAAQKLRAQRAAQLSQREAQQRAVRDSDVILNSPNGSLKLPGVDLERGVVVGRSAERSDVVLPREQVSREHARFTRQAGRLYVYDLSSRNGVYVNNIRIPACQERMLSNGDSIGFGDSLTFTLEFS